MYRSFAYCTIDSRLAYCPPNLALINNDDGGAVGVYTSGPISGRIMDTRGPRPLLIGAFFALLCGYLGIRLMYDAGLDDGDRDHLSHAHLVLLIFCSYLTGVGSNSGMTSGMNSTGLTS